jgi:hypothetical protein
VVEHRSPLGVANGVLLARRQAVDAGGQVDLLGLGGHVAHHDLGRRHVAVLGQGVVLAEPGVLPVELVGVDRVLDLTPDHLVLAGRVVRRRAGQVAVQEDPEFHAQIPLAQVTRSNVSH